MRLEITRRAELAVRAMVVLGQTDSHVKASTLADALSTTAAFVPQIMGPLVRAGWVGSDPGPTGGYRTIVGLDRLNVLQVIEAVDGLTDAGRCVVADRSCRAESPCTLHSAWSSARLELTRILEHTSLAQLDPALT